jgi:hypothetical protein
VLRGHDRDYFPASATVEVGRKAEALAFLHALAWGAEGPVASYLIRYADGRELVLPIRQGEEILSWWGWRETEEVKIAVTGHNLATRRVAMHVWTWRNPRPEAEIETLEFRSTESEGVPIIVAATVLDEMPTLHSERPKQEVPPEGFVMIEAEDFDTYNVPPQKEPEENSQGKVYDTWPDPRFSGGELFEIRPPKGARNPVHAEEPRYVKEGALRLTYSFRADRSDTYTLWARVGPANVYSPFRWKVDDGRWGEVTREDPFLDMWHVSFWYTLGWIRLGERELQQGEHVLHIEVPRPGGGLEGDRARIKREIEGFLPEDPSSSDDAARRRSRWVLGADCFAVSSVPFHPCGHLKAGERFRNKPWLDRAGRTAVVNVSGERFERGGTRKRFWLDGV